MENSDGREAYEAFVSRYCAYLDGIGHLDAKYRREFIDALFERASAIAAARPGRLSLADDYDRGCGMEDVLSETGGCEWSCPEHGTSSPNRPRCDCPFPPIGGSWPQLAREASEATAAWVAEWETAHGSRFLPWEEVLASLRREVWRHRRLRRQVRRESRGWLRKLRRQWTRSLRSG